MFNITQDLARRRDRLKAMEAKPDNPRARAKVGFVSLGCPKNLVDSEVMMGVLAANGAELTAEACDADVIVVNTCAFIDSAKQESVNTILEMAQHKRACGGQAKKLIVAGCLVERYRNEIRENIPEVDAVVGTGELESILAAAGLEPREPVRTPSDSPFVILGHSAVQKATAGALPPAGMRAEGRARESRGRFSRTEWSGAIADLPNYLMTEATPRVLATGRSSAYLKIAEGCDHPCTFCVIPQLRGRFRSRRFESVVAEAERLAAAGVKELTLIGQDTTCYGEDLGLKDGLALLLRRLVQIEGVRWVRSLYTYPNKITGRLLETIASEPKLCSYVDVPLQHASPRVLKRMKRGGNADIFLRTIETMRRTVPGLTLRTSFIVGFPGETDDDFAQLKDFVQQAEFDWLGVFGYSDEEGSPAHAMDGKVSPREIERRRKNLMDLQRGISRRKKRSLVGRQTELLLTGPSEESDLLWEGRTEMHAPEIDGKVYVNDLGSRVAARAGEFVRCEITDAHDYDLVARIVE
jgi:ribosomal protein S12 methylthiotransferase